MLKKYALGGLAAFALTLGAQARAEEYKDYAYEKGAMEISSLECDQNHVDDYLIGLKKTYLPIFQVLKKHGLVDWWAISVRDGSSHGIANVMIVTHYVSYEAMSPNRERDVQVNREIEALIPTSTDKAQVAEYEKYRRLIDDAHWRTIDFK